MTKISNKLQAQINANSKSQINARSTKPSLKYKCCGHLIIKYEELKK